MAKNAVLVNLTIHKFSNEKNDRTVVAKVAADSHATVSEDRYIKKRIPKSYMKKINAIISQIVTSHRVWASPWYDGGIRILPAKLILKYLAHMKQLRMQLEEEVEEVGEKLREVDAEKQRTRGSLYDPDEIPSKYAFVSAFKVDIEVLPFPVSSDFRVDVISEQMKKKFEDAMSDKLHQNTPHVLNLFIDPVKRLANATKYYQSTLDKLAFACEVALDMLLDDSLHDQIQHLCRTIEDQVLCFDIADIRSSQIVQEKFLKGIEEVQTLLQDLSEHV